MGPLLFKSRLGLLQPQLGGPGPCMVQASTGLPKELARPPWQAWGIVPRWGAEEPGELSPGKRRPVYRAPKRGVF